jgi:hypothetical protein
MEMEKIQGKEDIKKAWQLVVEWDLYQTDIIYLYSFIVMLDGDTLWHL